MNKLEYLKNKIKYLHNFKENVIILIFDRYTIEELYKLSENKCTNIIKNYIKTIITKNKGSLSIDYYIIRGWDIVDAKNKITDLQKQRGNSYKENKKNNPLKYNKYNKITPFTTQYWLNKGFNLEEAKYKLKTFKKSDIEYWLNKGFNLEEAKENLQKFQSNNANSYKQKRLENPEKYKKSFTSQIGYWLERNFTEEESKKLVKHRQTTFTLEKCIKKYGEVKGIEVYNIRQIEWLNKIRKNFEENGDGRCIQSKWAKEIIVKLCNRLDIEIPKKEKWISNGTLSFSYDFTLGNKIIEFNGNFWHCNPSLYQADFYNKVKLKTAQEIWDLDYIKTELAINYGYEVLVIWENENNLENILNKCYNFLIK